MTTDEATREILRHVEHSLRAVADVIAVVIERDGQITRWYGVGEYAALTGSSETTVMRRCRAGELPGAKKLGNRWAIPVKEAS